MINDQDLILPKGYSDFRKLRLDSKVYVDKSFLVHRVLNDSSEVILIPRPRRFGKTLNLSMLRYFFEKLPQAQEQAERKALFDGLKITQDAKSMQHFGQYPVLFVSFKDIKGCHSWNDMYDKIKNLLPDLYLQYLYLSESSILNEVELKKFRAVFKRQASKAVLEDSLKDLCLYLKKMHQKNVLLLIDEYDTPMHEAYLGGYHQDAMPFFRNFLSAALKDNNSIFRVVLTGIMRVAKESIFSGLNNLGVYTLTQHYYASDFGFTEQEVTDLTTRFGCLGDLEDIKYWYNGYQFADQVIYNPWSVMAYLSNRKDGFQPYWANTAKADLIEQALLNNPSDLKEDLEHLLHGGSLERRIKDNVTLDTLKEDPDMVWSLLLFSGYLKAERTFYVDETDLYAELKIPNLELRAHLKSLVQSWFLKFVPTGTSVDKVIRAFLSGTEEELVYYLESILLHHVSFLDAQEHFFHGLVLGLLVNLSPRYAVHSNRESGFGRCDVVLTPKNTQDMGIIIEFKVVRKKSKESAAQALKSAMEQIKTRDYMVHLKDKGITHMRLLALAFSSKRVAIQIEHV